MSGFLDELGKKAAERWLTLLVLPGLLWMLTLLMAVHLRHAAPADVQPVIDATNTWASKRFTTPAVVALLAGLLLFSAGVGTIATGLAGLVRRIWVLPGRRRPARWLVNRRRHRWDEWNQKAEQVVHAAINTDAGTQPVITADPTLADTLARRDAISLERPSRPSWIGDRWQSTVTHVHRSHGLDLTVAWPRLWTVLPDNLRTDITTAQTAYIRSSTLTSWAVLYLVPALYWWPAVLVTLITTAVSIVRARTTTNTLCLLVETAADLHTKTLAEKIGTPDLETGRMINSQIRHRG